MTTLKPGDRAEVIRTGSNLGKRGTVIRVSGGDSKAPIIIIAMDEEHDYGEDSAPYREDLIGAKSIGLDISKRFCGYYEPPALKPIIDAKSPIGTKVRVNRNGSEREAVLLAYCRFTANSFICHVPSATPATDANAGFIGLVDVYNREPAALLGINPDTERFAIVSMSDLTFTSSPGTMPKSEPKSAFTPGTKVIADGVDGVFVCINSGFKGYGVLTGGKQTCRLEGNQAVCRALGMDPALPDYRSVLLDQIELAPAPTQSDIEMEANEASFVGLKVGEMVLVRITLERDDDGHPVYVEVEGVVVALPTEDCGVAIALKEHVDGTYIPESVDVAAAAKMGITLTADNCWECADYDTRVIARLGMHNQASFGPALMVAGVALGGLLSALCRTGSKSGVRVAEAVVEAEAVEAIEEVAHAD